MILITGAAGKTGQALLQALNKRSAWVRAMVRTPVQGEVVKSLGASEVLVGDLHDREDLHQACQGITAIYHICPNMQADEFAIAAKVVEAATAAGVPRFVYHSVLHPQTQAMPHHWHKLQVEEQLFTTRLDFTILQPAAYMQNVLASWSSITAAGLYRVPYQTTTQLGMVDLHDVAEAAAQVLTTAGHSGATYELASGEWLTQDAVAAILSKVLARPVRAEMQPRVEWETHARQSGLTDYAIATLLKMFDYYERHGFGGNGTILRGLLGREPTRFADCMARYASAEALL
ncbi:MAG: NmrA family NAD(P)-binding protein [Caldilineaceae bacterium]|nr:NmrA family NAD(P)-binding protein [Caldilineaceae bacterium]